MPIWQAQTNKANPRTKLGNKAGEAQGGQAGTLKGLITLTVIHTMNCRSNELRRHFIRYVSQNNLQTLLGIGYTIQSHQIQGIPIWFNWMKAPTKTKWISPMAAFTRQETQSRNKVSFIQHLDFVWSRWKRLRQKAKHTKYYCGCGCRYNRQHHRSTSLWSVQLVFLPHMVCRWLGKEVQTLRCVMAKFSWQAAPHELNSWTHLDFTTNPIRLHALIQRMIDMTIWPCSEAGSTG